MLPLIIGDDGLLEEYLFWKAFAGGGIDGNKTVVGTETLTSTQYWDVLTVPNGATLITDGYGIFANKIIISGSGKISNSGNNPSSPDWWSIGAAKTDRELGGSGAGGIGAGNAGTGAAPNVAGDVLAVAVGLGGAGGAAGASGAGAGGAGAPGASGGSITNQLMGWPRLNPSLVFSRGATLCKGGAGGARAAPGGGDGAYAYSGGTSSGAGGGAGVLALACGELDISAAQAACIQAIGGSCPQSTAAGQGNGTNNAGGAGGSGGGGGGYIHALVGQIIGSLMAAISAAGGAGGKGGNGAGTGVGGTGGTGGKGGNIDVFDFERGIWLSVRGSNGTAGSAPSGTTGGAGGAGGACLLDL